MNRGTVKEQAGRQVSPEGGLFTSNSLLLMREGLLRNNGPFMSKTGRKSNWLENHIEKRESEEPRRAPLMGLGVSPIPPNDASTPFPA